MTLKHQTKKHLLKIVIAVPSMFLITYFFFFWGKPMDVSWGIWLEAKKIYGYYEQGIEEIDRNGEVDLEIRKFQYKHAEEAFKNEVASKYSSNERSIVQSVGSVLHDGRICMDEQVSAEAKSGECFKYESALETLRNYFD